MISIIVPIYKIEDLLPECIESLICQTYRDIEIILVDDGSPDNCPKICDEYAKKDDRIRVIHKSNGGLVSARKAGLQIAKGDYIGYVDGDDWVEPQMYEDFANIASQYDADIIAAGFKKDIGSFTSEKINSLPCGFYRGEQITDYIVPNMLYNQETNQPGIYTYVWNKILKKSVLYASQMNVDDDIFLGEDAACVYPGILQANSLYITDSCYYHYRQRSNSMLKLNVGIEKDVKGIKLLYKYLNEEFSKSEFYHSLYNSLNMYVLYLLTSRTGGVLLSDDIDLYLYKCKNNNLGCKIAIYGAGTIGQHLYRRLNSNQLFDIIKWVDPDYIALREHGLSVDSPSSVADADFDNLIIAIMDQAVAEEIRNEMINYGVEKSKIILSDLNNVNSIEILNKFGIVD